MTAITAKYAAPLHPIFTKPKRVKVIVGGRGGMKSTGVASFVSIRMACGGVWCCAREYKESIDDSVHSLLLSEIDLLGLPGFNQPTRGGISHMTGGRCFYKGIARNPSNLKSSLTGVEGIWFEEAEAASDLSLDALTASVRLSKADAERVIAGEDVRQPELIFTMNRGYKSGAVARRYLARAEPELARCGYYEDDELMVVQVCYTDVPKAWFLASGLEVERASDEANMTPAGYWHKWGNGYRDEVDDTPLIPFSQIKQAEDSSGYGRDKYAGGETYIGNDIAIRNDLWVAWVIERVGDVLVTREIKCLHKGSFAEHDLALDDMVAFYSPIRVAIDQSGMGEKPTEDAKNRYGSGKVEGVIFNNKSKHILAQCGKQAFEAGRVRIPEDQVVRADIYKIKQTTTPMGHPRFDAARDNSGHADRAWALFLAIYAATSFSAPASGVQGEEDDTAFIPERMRGRRRLSMR